MKALDETVERVDLRRDLDGLVELEAASFRNPWTREMLLAELAEVAVALAYVVRTTDRQQAGYCSCRLIEDELHLNNLAVHPTQRRCGLGRRLLEHLLHDVFDLGARRVTLEVRASNAAALALYDSLAFVRRGLRRGYYTMPVEDAVILWRSLP